MGRNPVPRERRLSPARRHALACAALLALSTHSLAATLYWDGTSPANPGNGSSDGGGGVWSTNGLMLNWDLTPAGASHVAWTDGNIARFGGTPGGVTIDSAVSAAGVEFAPTTTAGYVLGGTNTLTLTAAGFSSFAPSVANTIKAPVSIGSGVQTLVQNGTVVFDTGGSLNYSTAGSLSVGNGDNATLTLQGAAGFSGASSELVIGNASGQGTLNVAGNATLSAGRLWVGRAPSAGTGGGTGAVVQSGGQVTLSAANGLTLGGNVNDTGTNAGAAGTYHLDGGRLTTNVVRRGAGTATFNFNGGTLAPAAANTAFMTGLTTANVRDGGAIIDAGFNVTVNQSLVHSGLPNDKAIDGGLTKTGSGTLVLTGTNTYTGATTVSEGKLQLGAGGTTGSITGGTITLTAASSALVVDRSNAMSLDNAITGAGSVSKTGVGALTLSGPNDYQGGTSIGSNAVVVAGSDSALGTGPVTMAGSGFLQAGGGTRTLTNAIRLSGGSLTIGGGQSLVLNGDVTVSTANRTIDNTLATAAEGQTLTLGGTIYLSDSNSNTRTLTIGSGANTSLGTTYITGAIKNNPAATADTASNFAVGGGGTIVLTGVNAYTGTTTVSNTSTKLVIGNGGATGNLGGGAVTVTDATLTFNRSNSMTVANAIGGTGTVTQTGGGTTFLTNNNSYSGGTSIVGGTLVANNSISSTGTGDVNIEAGGTLAGSGVIISLTSSGRTVAVRSGGTITAGSGATSLDRVGSLTTNNQTWAGGGRYAFKIAATENGTINPKTPEGRTAGAGVLWDKISLNTLTLSATSGNKFVIKLVNASGGVLVFKPGQAFEIANIRLNGVPTATELSTKFQIDASGLGLNNSLFSLTTATAGQGESGTNVLLSFSGNANAESTPEPGTAALVGLAGSVVLTRRRRHG